MPMTIRRRAETLATMRGISIALMERLARWVPETPEMEIKLLFGRHIWEFAQHADLLGRRTAELRAALHFTLQPAESYRLVLDRLAGAPTGSDRVALFYDAVLPDLEHRYRAYLSDTDPLLDEPSVRIIERILADFPRLAAERAALLVDRPDLARHEAGPVAELAAMAGGAGDIVSGRAAAGLEPA